MILTGERETGSETGGERGGVVQTVFIIMNWTQQYASGRTVGDPTVVCDYYFPFKPIQLQSLCYRFFSHSVCDFI